MQYWSAMSRKQKAGPRTTTVTKPGNPDRGERLKTALKANIRRRKDQMLRKGKTKSPAEDQDEG